MKHKYIFTARPTLNMEGTHRAHVRCALCGLDIVVVYPPEESEALSESKPCGGREAYLPKSFTEFWGDQECKPKM